MPYKEENYGKENRIYYRWYSNMGWAAVQEMLKHPNEINIKMLARKSPKTKKNLRI